MFNLPPSLTKTLLYYLYCDAVVVKIIITRNGLKWMLDHNRSSINILFGVNYDRMLVDYKLTPMTDPLYGFTSDNIILKER